MLWFALAVAIALSALNLARRMSRSRTRLVDGVPIAVKGADRAVVTLIAYLPPTRVEGRWLEARDRLFAMFQSVRIDAFRASIAPHGDGFELDGERLFLRVPQSAGVDAMTTALAALARDLGDPRWTSERLADLAERGPDAVRVRAAMLLVTECPGSDETRRACAALGWTEESAREAARGGLSLPIPTTGALSLDDSSADGGAPR